MLSEHQVSHYLDRLGFSAPPAIDTVGLRALHRAHLRHVPFENLDIHLGVPIVLDVDRLVDKITVRRRGGFCYELNGAFGALLDALGFNVRYLEARVYEGGRLGIHFDHLCLRVETDAPHLVDVGFGACFDDPLTWTSGRQHDPAGTFEIVPRSDDWFELLHDGEPQYQVCTVARTLSDFEDGCRHHQTSPESHFTHNAVCSIRTADGRATLRGTRLVETHCGRRDERDLDPEELGAAYTTLFGIKLDDAEVASLTH